MKEAAPRDTRAIVRIPAGRSERERWGEERSEQGKEVVLVKRGVGFRRPQILVRSYLKAYHASRGGREQQPEHQLALGGGGKELKCPQWGG